MHTLNKIKHKCLQIALQATKNPNALLTGQVDSNFPLCFNSSLNSCRDFYSFSFIGRSIHKM